MEHQRVFPNIYSDNDSKFKLDCGKESGCGREIIARLAIAAPISSTAAGADAKVWQAKADRANSESA